MKHLLNITLLATLIIFSTCKEDEAPITTGTIKGKITDADTGSPLEGANVKSQPPTSTINTDASGEYTIANANEGNYTIFASKPGYVTDSTVVRVTANTTANGDIALTFRRGGGEPCPGKPINVSPKPDTVNQNTTPILEWSATHPDGDSLTYDVLFGTENPPTDTISFGQDSTTFQVNGLDHETVYFWQIIAKDTACATPGDVWKFTTEEANNNPEKPKNIAPKPDTVNQDTTLVLEWKATDPDEDPLTYDVLFGKENPPTDTISFDQDSTTFQVEGLDHETTYYWQIIAKDDRGGKAEGDVWKFTTKKKNNPPSKPELVSPPDGATKQQTFLTLAWKATDPDGDELTYDVLLDTDTTDQQIDTLLWDHESASHKIDTLKKGGIYYWKVIAKDSHGATTASDVWNFTTISPPDPGFPYNQDFEGDDIDWFADNGLWQIGVPTVGPEEAHSGEIVAGTVLDGNYPGNANTRLICPEITLPSLGGGEKIQLKFWHWFRFSDDSGHIQISVDDGEWETISDPRFDGTSTTWTQYVADLTAYAGKNVRIAFYFTSTTFNVDNGWYIDDVSIEKKVVTFNNPEDFEMGVGDWSADNGLWEVGITSVGPEEAHSGEQIAGTVLDGNFHGNANTRLISPEITLPSLGGG